MIILPNNRNFIVAMAKWKTQTEPDGRQYNTAQEE